MTESEESRRYKSLQESGLKNKMFDEHVKSPDLEQNPEIPNTPKKPLTSNSNYVKVQNSSSSK